VLPYKQRPKQERNKPLISYTTAESYIKTGYRRDDFEYNIGTRSGVPNIISELKWRDIDIATLNIGSTLRVNQKWLFNVDLLYGRIYDGRNQDSDYQGSNRTQEFSRSNNDADKGDVLDISGYVGYDFLFDSSDNDYARINIIPKLGLSYKSQNFTMTNGVQTVAVDAPSFGFTAPSLGPFVGLDSTYDTTWFGPWTGIEFKFGITPKFTVSSNFELHYADYSSNANWNLRSDFAHPKSFSHDAHGFGLVSSIDGKIDLGPTLSLTMSLNYQYWRADQDGEITRYLSDGRVIKGQPFNEAKWRSFGTNLGLVYEF
jgi:hypothetical protein